MEEIDMNIMIYIFAIIGVYYVSTKIGAFLYGIYLGLIKVRKPETLDAFDKEALAASNIHVEKFKIWYYKKKLHIITKKMTKERKAAEKQKKNEWKSDLDWINHRK
jgi:hypothetical protein